MPPTGIVANSTPEPTYPRQDISIRSVPDTVWRMKPPVAERIRPPIAIGVVHATIWRGVAPMTSDMLSSKELAFYESVVQGGWAYYSTP